MIDTSGLIAQLSKEGTEEALIRAENILEFVSAVQQYFEAHPDDTMAEFLSTVALVADTDGYDADNGTVTLMTLHSAKGLEFPVVFLIGLEEGLCPHFRSIGDELAVEEERRLCYVGITRAKDRLFITYAMARNLMGMTNHNQPSRFLAELPDSVELSGVGLEETSAAKGTTFVQRSAMAPRFSAKPNNSSFKPSMKPAQQLVLEKNDRVRHPSFGEGIVINIEGSGSSVMADIDFNQKGIKKIALKYATMEKI